LAHESCAARLSQLLLAATAYGLQPPLPPPRGKWGHQAVVEVCSSHLLRSSSSSAAQQLSSLRLWQNRENKLTL